MTLSIFTALALLLPATAAGAATTPGGSGGSGIPPAPAQPPRVVKKPGPVSKKPAKKKPAAKKPAPPKPRKRTTGQTPRNQSSTTNPFAGRGMWIWYVSASNSGDLRSIIATAHANGVSTLMVKAGDGTNQWSQFSPQLISALHANGLKVCAWQYIYGSRPAAEAAVSAAAVHEGADCFVIDAESEYEGQYVAAQTYITELRKLIGSSFPVALAGFPYVDYHPSYPYSVFLGPGGAQYNVPQMYWVDIGVSVDDVYQHTFAYNRLYGRMIVPLGQTYNSPAAQDVMRFRQLSRAYGAPGVSWWDWQESGPAQWQAVAQSVKWLTGFTWTWQPPVLQQGMSGDLVVWAQEHLITAGYPVAINGSFSQETATAVQRFQLARGFIPDGQIDAPTWQALLAYAPAKIIWTAKGPQPASTGINAALVHRQLRRAVLEQPPPRSAALPARAYEIPPRVGAG